MTIYSIAETLITLYRDLDPFGFRDDSEGMTDAEIIRTTINQLSTMADRTALIEFFSEYDDEPEALAAIALIKSIDEREVA